MPTPPAPLQTCATINTKAFKEISIYFRWKLANPAYVHSAIVECITHACSISIPNVAAKEHVGARVGGDIRDACFTHIG